MLATSNTGLFFFLADLVGVDSMILYHCTRSFLFVIIYCNIFILEKKTFVIKIYIKKCNSQTVI